MCNDLVLPLLPFELGIAVSYGHLNDCEQSVYVVLHSQCGFGGHVTFEGAPPRMGLRFSTKRDEVPPSLAVDEADIRPPHRVPVVVVIPWERPAPQPCLAAEVQPSAD